MNPEPQPYNPPPKAKTAIGAAEPCPVVLVEVSGALGVLLAQRRCPGELLEEVLYFRILMGEPYAMFLKKVELITIDGYTIARASQEDALLYEPSLVAYEIKNITPQLYESFVDHIVDHDVGWVEGKLLELFSDCAGFHIDAEGKLAGPENYGCGMDYFMNSHSFIEPKEARRSTS